MCPAYCTASPQRRGTVVQEPWEYRLRVELRGCPDADTVVYSSTTGYPVQYSTGGYPVPYSNPVLSGTGQGLHILLVSRFIQDADHSLFEFLRS
jgi:hypothetical protein